MRDVGENRGAAQVPPPIDQGQAAPPASAAREIRDILSTALNIIEVIASKAPAGSSVRGVLYAEVDAMRQAANAILKRATES